MALAGFATAGTLPAAAAPSIIQYVALGDSYAAGQGAPPYDSEACKRSANGYPGQLHTSESRIGSPTNAACSGARTDTVVLPPELNSARLVTLTVGAANLGLSDVARACLAGTLPDCLNAIKPAQLELGDCPGGESPLGGRLLTLYGEVAAKAPNARIVVTGYPLLFESPADTDHSELAAKIRAINEATTTLNCVIERSVATAHEDVNIYYVDVTEEFEGHGIGGSLPPFINPPPLNAPPNAESFHPTVLGYGAYAEAIKTKLPSGWLDKPST
jgi:lysophospholipase L1-like esterase